MKSTIQKNREVIFDKVQVNKALNKYSNVVLFPKKLAKAKEAFEKFGFPQTDSHK